jgi:glycosyltransferase involved in cell wall biosynthesis
MSKRDDVSVILPVFDGELYLAEAIESVLAQTHPPQEIIVVDDGSTDGSSRIAQKYAERQSNVRCFRQPNRGIGSARNHGVSEARGDYLAFLDADDLWPADRLALQRAVFDQTPGVDLVFGHVTQFVSPDLSDEERREILCPSDPMPGYLATTLLVPQGVFHRVGLFDTALRIGEFLDWYLRATELQLRAIMLPDVIMQRRIHTRNQGRRHREARTDYTRALKAALDRRRGATDDVREPR